jgi:hypothetical protein
MNYETLASTETLTKIIPALKERGIDAEIIVDKAGALARIKELIPQGASVQTGASRTLEEIGFVEYLKSDTHGWNNLKAGIVAEQDPDAQARLRKEANLSDYYLGSIHALAEDGQFLVASNTGSQLPHIVYTSQNLILVVGAQKVVPTLPDAYKRLIEHVVPLEDLRMKEVYGPKAGTNLSKIVTFSKEAPFNKRNIRMLLVQEKLGF